MAAGTEWTAASGSPYWNVEFSADSKWIAYASDYVQGAGGTVTLVDIAKKSPKTITTAGSVFGFTANGEYLVYCEGLYPACSIRSYRLSDANVSTGPVGYVTAFSPTEARIAIRTSTGTPPKFGLASWTLGAEAASIVASNVHASNAVFSADGSRLYYFTNSDGTGFHADLMEWNVTTSTSLLIANSAYPQTKVMPEGPDVLFMTNLEPYGSTADLYYWYAQAQTLVLVAKSVGVEQPMSTIVPWPDGSRIMYLADYASSPNAFSYEGPSTSSGTLMAWNPATKQASQIDDRVLWRHFAPVPNGSAIFYIKNPTSFAVSDLSWAILGDLRQWSPQGGIVPIDSSVLVPLTQEVKPLITNSTVAYIRYSTTYPESLQSGVYAMPLK